MNQSVRQEPQNECRQSRRVSGWYSTSVQMEHVNSFSRSMRPEVFASAAILYKFFDLYSDAYLHMIVNEYITQLCERLRKACQALVTRTTES